MNKLTRVLVLLAVLVAGGIFLFPTFRWYVLTSQEDKDIATGAVEEIREYAEDRATYHVDSLKSAAAAGISELPEDSGPAIEAARKAYEDAGRTVPSEWTPATVLSAFSSEERAFDAFEAVYREKYLGLKSTGQNVLQLGLDLRGGMSVLLEADTASLSERLGHEASSDEVATAVAEAAEVLKNRIDQFGVSEPDVRVQGTDRILIEIPGTADPERINTFLRGRGSLEFVIVDETQSQRLRTFANQNPGLILNEDGTVRDQDWLPEGRRAAGVYTTDEYGLDVLETIVVLDETQSMDGSYLTNVEVSRDQMNGRPVVNFTFNSEGGDLFYELTSNNIRGALAVVMDGRVRFMATVNSAISNAVQASGFNEAEAQALAVTLRTANLPIDLNIASQQSVGASLGSDTVYMGMRAIAVGLALVALFMFLYYGVAGLTADFALIIDLFLMLAVLSALKFTVTLTSVAGLILTIGMAVDSNVIIYERMKEELALGKSSRAAVKAGYEKALSAIMDANVTTIIAALVLSQLGSSAVKGFANTLAVGIVCSVFSTLFVTHLIFDFFVTDRKRDVKLRLRLFGRAHYAD